MYVHSPTPYPHLPDVHSCKRCCTLYLVPFRSRPFLPTLRAGLQSRRDGIKSGGAACTGGPSDMLGVLTAAVGFTLQTFQGISRLPDS